jgi:hypothetical protein
MGRRGIRWRGWFRWWRGSKKEEKGEANHNREATRGGDSGLGIFSGRLPKYLRQEMLCGEKVHTSGMPLKKLNQGLPIFYDTHLS